MATRWYAVQVLRVLLAAGLVAVVSAAPRSARAHYLDVVVNSMGSRALSCVPNLPPGAANCAMVTWGGGTVDGCLPAGSVECCQSAQAFPCPVVGGIQLVAVPMMTSIADSDNPTVVEDCLCVTPDQVAGCAPLLGSDPGAVDRCAARDCDGDGFTNDVDPAMCVADTSGTLPPGSDAGLRGGGGCACAIGRVHPAAGLAVLAAFLFLALLVSRGLRSSRRRPRAGTGR